MNAPAVLPDSAQIEQRKAEVIRLWGDWTAHNIHLKDEIYTIGPDREADKLKRIVQIVSDLSSKPIERLRVLDLGALEGGYAVELARRGAQVVAIEGRRANLEKILFVKDVLGLQNLQAVQDDVRNLQKLNLGSFDVILCLGLLYHLDFDGVLSLCRQIFDSCDRMAIFDTYVGIGNLQRFEANGKEYWGRVVREHLPQSSMEERLADKWASLDNTESLWITRNSLYNLLGDLGFTSAYECHFPTEVDKLADRLTFVAIKGTPQRLLAMPRTNEDPMGRLPKYSTTKISHKQRLLPIMQERATNLVPISWRRSLKGLMRRKDAKSR
jgi:SAM-dependent methyltransferase